MLNSLRSGGNSKVMWAIVGLLMLGLTGFGLGGLGGGTIRSIGSVGDEKIPVTTYYRALNGAVNDFNRRTGQNLTASDIERFGVSFQVLGAVIGVAALNNEANRIGLSVGDDLVRNAIVNNPNFQGLDGSFDKTAYEFFLERSLQVSAAEFDELLRKENARSLLEGSIRGGIASSDAVPLALLTYIQESRDFEWAWVTDLQLGDQVAKPNDAQLQSYYDANTDNYRSLKTHDVTYVWLDPANLLDSVTVPDNEIRESYELQFDRFNKVEQRALDRLVFPSTAEAEDARNRLDAGSLTFEALVQERGLEIADVELGEVAANTLTQAAAEVVFATDGPGVVGPVESSLGPALFRINAILAEDVTPFEEAREQLTAELAGEAARRMVSDLIGDIDDLLADDTTLQELAEDTDMVLGTIAYTSESDEGIAGYEAFRTAVLAAKTGDFPELVDLSDGGVFALQVDAIREPAQIPFDQAHSDVTADWTKAETLKALNIVAEDFKTKLESGRSFADLELAPNAEQDALRSRFYEGLPSGSLPAIFELEPGKVALLQGDSGVFLARLTAINPFDASAEENAAIVSSLTTALDAQVGSDILDLFTTALEEAADVQLNQAAINSVNAGIATRQ
ncbi:MAG: hypothetical protein GY947_11750 [Rhodobacteraceae bacterium]|nr:hypothetical protein [Paracoccaceae bacterium]